MSINGILKKMSVVVLFSFFVMIGCSGSSPSNVVENYIDGVQNNDAKIVWQSSSFDSFDESLMKEEKEKKFKNFREQFDKKENEIFKLFTTNAKFKIFSVEKKDSENNVFVEAAYPSDKPFRLNEYKTATKLKIAFVVKNEKGINYIGAFNWKAVEYNKKYDNREILNFVETNKKKNLLLCYKKCKSVINSDPEYFSDVKALSDSLFKEMLRTQNEVQTKKFELSKLLTELEKKKKNIVVAAMDKNLDLEDARDELKETRNKKKKDQLEKKIQKLQKEMQVEKQKILDVVKEINDLKTKINNL